MCDDGVVWAELGLRLGLLTMDEGVRVKGVRRVGEWKARVNKGRQLIVMVDKKYLKSM